MYLIAAIKMALCLVDIINDDVSQNYGVSSCSSTKTVASCNLSQHILTMIVKLEIQLFCFCEIWHAHQRIELRSLL